MSAGMISMAGRNREVLTFAKFWDWGDGHLIGQFLRANFGPTRGLISAPPTTLPHDYPLLDITCGTVSHQVSRPPGSHKWRIFAAALPLARVDRPWQELTADAVAQLASTT